jgi:hypothetical protein
MVNELVISRRLRAVDETSGSGSHQLQKPVHMLNGHSSGKISQVYDWKRVY